MNWQVLSVLTTLPAAAQLLMLRHVARGRKKFGAATINLITQLEMFFWGLWPYHSSGILHYTSV